MGRTAGELSPKTGRQLNTTGAVRRLGGGGCHHSPAPEVACTLHRFNGTIGMTVAIPNIPVHWAVGNPHSAMYVHIGTQETRADTYVPRCLSTALRSRYQERQHKLIRLNIAEPTLHR